MNDIFSMTGYGKGIAQRDGVKATVELRAVNHRFLDLGLKVPKTLMFVEDCLRKEIQKAVVRGHIDVYVSFDDSREKKNSLKVDYGLANQYVLAARELQGRCLIQNNLFVNEVMRMPDVVSCEAVEDEESAKIIGELAIEACRQALENLNVMRKKEGQLLVKDLLLKLDNIDGVLPKIEALAPKTVEEYREKMSARIKEFLQEVPIDEDKLVNEAAFFSDRICTDEELTRLHTHIAHFRDILKEGGAIGKKLDFIVQEMNRETNTIGSKCNNASITECVIFLKSEIEKIREQIQNVE